MAFLDKIQELYSKVSIDNPTHTFILGVIIATLAIYLIRILLWMISARRRRCKELIIPGDKGDLSLTVHAVKQFVARIVSNFPDSTLVNLIIRKKGSGISMRLIVALTADANAAEIQSQIKESVRSEAQNRLGIDETLLREINIKIIDHEANGTKIARKNTKYFQTSTPVAELAQDIEPEEDLPPIEM